MQWRIGQQHANAAQRTQIVQETGKTLRHVHMDKTPGQLVPAGKIRLLQPIRRHMARAHVAHHIVTVVPVPAIIRDGAAKIEIQRLDGPFAQPRGQPGEGMARVGTHRPVAQADRPIEIEDDRADRPASVGP